MSANIICAPGSPYDGRPLQPGQRIEHASARETDDERDFGGGCYCVRMECPDCGTSWWSELAQ